MRRPSGVGADERLKCFQRPPAGGGAGGGTKASVSGPGRRREHRSNECQGVLLGVRNHKSGFPPRLKRVTFKRSKGGAEGVTLLDLHSLLFMGTSGDALRL